MILALDGHYDGDIATAAAVGFDAWTDAAPTLTETYVHTGVAPYVSGALYRRELPVLLPLVRRLLEDHPQLHGAELRRIRDYLAQHAPELVHRLAETLVEGR